jgi:hypothetical protein
MTTSTDNLVTLAELSTDMEASMIIAALEREGIEAFMKGEFTSGFRAEAPSWPKVEVRESDYKRARAILDAMNPHHDETPVDESEVTTDSPFRKFFLRLAAIGLVITIGWYGISLILTLFQILSSLASSLV